MYGIGSFIIKLLIWHEIWRLVRFLWLLPTVGPFLVVLLGLALVGLLAWRQRPGRSRRRGGLAGHGTGAGPRDW